MISVTTTVKEMLRTSGHRAKDLAEHMGITPQSLSNKMQGERYTVKDLVDIAKFCGCRLLVELPDGSKRYIEEK